MSRLYLPMPHSSSFDDDEEEESEFDPLSSPLIAPRSEEGSDPDGDASHEQRHRRQLSMLDVMVDALRKSMVICRVGAEEDGDGGFCSSSSADMSIGCPTDVRHVSHVTFDRFDGFLGLPVEFEPDVPSRAPSASASVFGVSANSMQCSYDNRGNSVPTILILMQKHLYQQGGLQVEGIFRVNGENSHEIYVRAQLNKGVVPPGIDSHCLAGLIKAWFRELPSGVLDCISPDQMMNCNTEDECIQLVRLLPPTEAALLHWAIDLMADVVEHEHQSKMNARNIAMVFAPNMTQMADPLTALIHAVQVMNFLKTLIIKTLRQREEDAAEARVFQSCSESSSDKDELQSMIPLGNPALKAMDFCDFDRAVFGKFLFPEHPIDSEVESFMSFEKEEIYNDQEIASDKSSSKTSDTPEDKSTTGCANGDGDLESLMDRLNFRKGVRKLCSHPIFQLSRSTKKSVQLGMVSSREEREAWA